MRHVSKDGSGQPVERTERDSETPEPSNEEKLFLNDCLRLLRNRGLEARTAPLGVSDQPAAAQS